MDGYLVPELAKKNMQYDMIEQHTDLPKFPYSRSKLLYIFLNKYSPLEGISELFSLVTSLVQMGLDTHDLVDVGTEHAEMKKMRTRQLRVLAGDYFSSRFYHLLSQAGQVEAVHSLSQAIAEVNRLKINLYMKMKKFKLTADEYFQQRIDIKSQLFLVFSKYMDGKSQKQWSELLLSITKCELITEELDRMTQNKNLKDSWGYWYLINHVTHEEQEVLKTESSNESLIQSFLLKYNIKLKLHQMLEKQWQEISDSFHSINNKSLQHELEKLGQPFRNYITASKV
ncbi:heptaprenyl diphosphate synthase component 1 [Chengkuizengella axinellae]|uniref:Heptaprenyl diphosphate synthase component 1 n=1 Tax=Chengkuizengella axinellae TaxID=3064388 RepID=A0ABT9IYA3_9BACL|nr:heptaprenyl diphosphate synthase component 1 [Chengkuizengella sp. 2205SS18-9]MDP5273795.1 heptaprenyl diphosphate synthase component 1 [Chengkuizengella sp. 2205SS18-9]